MTRRGNGGHVGVRLPDGAQLVRELARGARAHVYLAADGGAVEAVKVFPREHRARADAEFRHGHGLDHPNLNPIRARLEVAGDPAVRMAFVPGVQFGRMLPRLSRAAILDVLEAVLAALAHLHGRGVVHRDVKPENLLLTRERRSVLIDYDLAVAPGEATADGDAEAAGTVAYLSPEQARGEPVSARSDLYAVGVMLYRGLTGGVPFTGSVDGVLHEHRHVTPAPPSKLVTGTEAFDEVVRGLLAKAPEARFATADEARQAVRRARQAGGTASPR